MFKQYLPFFIGKFRNSFLSPQTFFLWNDVLPQQSGPLVVNGLGGFKHVFIFIPLFVVEDSHFDKHIFQMGWFNHQTTGVMYFTPI